MADAKNSEKIFWCNPEIRTILPLDNLRISKRDLRAIKAAEFFITIDSNFPATIHACANRNDTHKKYSENISKNDADTWINAEIEQAYIKLYEKGLAHSVEVYQNEILVGGLYGVAIGSAFFGESMFSKVSNASKAALKHLVEKMKVNGYELLDVQFQTEHLQRCGAVSISREKYLALLEKALQKNCQLK